jgi:signal transduction histidine kinase
VSASRATFFASTYNRLLLGYGFILLLAFVSVGGLSLAAYDRLVDHDTRQTVLAEHQGLLDIHRAEGLSGLAKAIDARVDQDRQREAVYLLTDPRGHVSAGHLNDVPAKMRLKPGWASFQWNEEGDIAIVYIERLSDGAILVTGHTTGEQLRLRDLIIRLGLVILVLLSALTLLLGWLLRHALDRTLQSALDVVDRFAAGHLQERIAVAGGDDAFTRLTITLNRMLDRIRDLIGGIQSSSDAIAHDLRTPLMRLKTRLEQVQQSHRDVSVDTAMNDAMTEADQILFTFNSLLRLARIEADAHAPTTHVALDRIATDAVEMWQAVAEANGRSIVTDIRPADIAGDSDLLFQMISNLLDNAVKYSHEGGQIRVDVRSLTDTVVLTIRDDGSGIPDKDRDRVFDRFVRLEPHRGTPGTGLGLSIVRAIAARHQAELRLDDGGPGVRIELRFARLTA